MDDWKNGVSICWTDFGGMSMNLFLQEHGEALVYGIVGVILISIICTVCTGKWKELTPKYRTDINKSNKEFNEENRNKYPVIEADEIIYATYKDREFNYKDYIVAKDFDGKDISEKIKYYGEVNVFKRGIYKLKCVVKSTSEMVCTKYINIIVE